MNLTRIRILLLLFAAVLSNVLILESIEEKLLQRNCFPYETACAAFRNHYVPEELAERYLEAADSDTEKFCDLLTMYFASDGSVTDVELLEKQLRYAIKYQPDAFRKVQKNVRAVWKDLKRFPVGAVSGRPEATVSFADSWMQSRTFGGERGHEGTDIMASVNERGLYPVYSMTDGVVENIGWLRLGGYRIGVRSPSGAYFYYAHLAEYAKEFQIGEPVAAGTFLGFMGDTGYSEIPGTTGNFDVHLHLGIYLNDESGKEFSVNSFPALRWLWGKNGEKL